MTMNTPRLDWMAAVLFPLTFVACNKNDDNNPAEGTQKRTITVENVLNSRENDRTQGLKNLAQQGDASIQVTAWGLKAPPTLAGSLS